MTSTGETSIVEQLTPPPGDTAGAATAAPPARQRLVVRPRPGWVAVDLRELWRYRELLWFMALRDIKVRYKQTALGAAWVILQPLLTMIVFSVFLGNLAGIQNVIRAAGSTVPYPVWNFAGLLPWTLFAYALQQSSNSLVQNERLITKVYFPRLIMPLSAVISGLVDFALAFLMLLGMMACFGVVPTLAALALPLFTLMAVVAAVAVGLWLSALNVQFRDVRYTIPFLIQFWMFLTPVVYPSSLVPPRFQALYGLNPMAGVVEGFRWALLGAPRLDWALMGASMAMTLLLLVGGLFFFRRMEKSFADVV